MCWIWATCIGTSAELYFKTYRDLLNKNATSFPVVEVKACKLQLASTVVEYYRHAISCTDKFRNPMRCVLIFKAELGQYGVLGVSLWSISGTRLHLSFRRNVVHNLETRFRAQS